MSTEDQSRKTKKGRTENRRRNESGLLLVWVLRTGCSSMVEPARAYNYPATIAQSFFAPRKPHHHNKVASRRWGFQVEGEDSVPLGSGFAHLSTSGESVARVIGVGPEPAQAQAPPLGGSEVVQPPGELCRPRISFAASAGPELVALETEEGEEEDDLDLIVSSPQVVVKIYERLIMSVVSIPSHILFLLPQ